MRFDKNLFVVYFYTLVSSDMRTVSDLILTSSFPISFDYSCCFSLNCFSSSFFSNISSYQANMACSVLSKSDFDTYGVGSVVIVGASYGVMFSMDTDRLFVEVEIMINIAFGLVDCSIFV